MIYVTIDQDSFLKGLQCWHRGVDAEALRTSRKPGPEICAAQNVTGMETSMTSTADEDKLQQHQYTNTKCESYHTERKKDKNAFVVTAGMFEE